MTSKITDLKKINAKKCERKGCPNNAYAIARAKFLCEDHYREIVPKKYRHYRMNIKYNYWGH